MSAVREIRRRDSPFLAVEFDTFSVAVGLAIVAGGLAVAAPYLDALTAALAALAMAGWAAGRARDRAAGVRWTLSGRAAGLFPLAIGTGAFFLLPGPLAEARGLALALSLMPMWWIERHRISGATVRASGTP